MPDPRSFLTWVRIAGIRDHSSRTPQINRNPVGESMGGGGVGLRPVVTVSVSMGSPNHQDDPHWSVTLSDKRGHSVTRVLLPPGMRATCRLPPSAYG